MGIFDELSKRRARQRREQRIKRGSRKRISFPSEDEQIDAYLDKYGSKLYNSGKRTWANMQGRKAEGKQLLKHKITHNLIGDTTRAILGTKKKKEGQ